MIDKATRATYKPTIGIEVHVQLNTATKLFSAVDNNAREAEPNTLISHVCLGMPGALPVLNEKVVALAMRAAFAFNTKPQKYSMFERKHYFYPDLPKGYQITQLEKPIIVGGYVDVDVDGESLRVRINRVQIEEDAGKSTHPTGKDYSLVDLNRAGTPLLEIVSEPDISSAAAARAYARELWLLVRYAGVSDADMYHGNMRFDVNVSVSKESDVLGTRTETKNLNSFRAVEKAVEYEIDRQIELLEKGEKIIQETRGWDDAKQKTFSQRSKEDSHDYRYFPDPDIPPIVLEDSDIRQAEKEMPTLPGHDRELYKRLGLNDAAIETLVIDQRNGIFIREIVHNASDADAKRVASWLVNVVVADNAQDNVITTWKLSWENAVKLSRLVEEGKLSSTSAKELWVEIWHSDSDPLMLAKERDLIQVSDESAILEIVRKVLADNPQAVQDVQNGEQKAIGFLVGQVMKASKGAANPSLATQLIQKELNR